MMHLLHLLHLRHLLHLLHLLHVIYLLHLLQLLQLLHLLDLLRLVRLLHLLACDGPLQMHDTTLLVTLLLLRIKTDGRKEWQRHGGGGSVQGKGVVPLQAVPLLLMLHSNMLLLMPLHAMVGWAMLLGQSDLSVKAWGEI
jgi:hypothetical protein